MRLPFPERIPLYASLFAATVLVGLQQLQRTDPRFSLYSFLFIVIATITFNAAGGFTRPSGSYVFFYAVLGVIVGICYKAYLGEPGDSNLRAPVLTMQVFTGGICSMLIAVLISRRITRRKAFLGTMLKEKDMRNAIIGCFCFGLFLSLINAVLPHQNSSALSAITQLDRFLPMSVILATTYAIKQSKGRSGISGLVLLSILVSISFGLISFSKEGMFTPIMAWLVAACSLRLSVRPLQLIIAAVIVFTMFHFLVPYSQYGRNLVPENATLGDRAQISFDLISNIAQTRQIYIEGTEEISGQLGAMQYYDEPQGFFDRLTMIGPDDSLIDYTSQGNFFGVSLIAADFANWVPHFLWPNKPTLNTGNMFAHKIGGVVGEDDITTGISFTPSGEAYQLAGWTGIFVVAPLIWIMVFTVFDSLCGDVRKSPWGLLVIAMFSHAAPEGMLDNLIGLVWLGSIGLIFVAVASAYVMPIVGTLFAGSEKTSVVIHRPRRIATPLSPRPSANRGL
jgi:hypothetical protein